MRKATHKWMDASIPAAFKPFPPEPSKWSVILEWEGRGGGGAREGRRRYGAKKGGKGDGERNEKERKGKEDEGKAQRKGGGGTVKEMERW